MLIKWIGHACFLLTFKNGKRVLIDPYAPDLGYEPVCEQADVVLVSHEHDDHNFTEHLAGDFQLIDAPGEYVIDGMKITGITLPHDEAQGAKRGQVVSFLIQAEGLTFLHMSDVGCMPQDAYFELLPKIDILMIPVGGVYTVDAQGAFAIMERIHPNITIPMHYMTSSLRKFALKGVHELIELAGGGYDVSRLGNAEFEITADNLKKRSRIMVMEHSN